MITRREALTLSLTGLGLLTETRAAPAPARLAITHATVIDGTGAFLPDHTVLIEADRIQSVAKAGSVNKTWFTPTMIATKSAIHVGDNKPDPRDRYVSASCRKITAELLTRPSYRAFLSPDSAARQTRDFNEMIPLVGLLHRQGVRLLAGTDCAVSIIYPGFSVHEELELLVAAGLTPMESLLAATANPANALGQKDLGIVRNCSLADLVILDANPLDDIRNTQKIRAVVSGGKMFGRADLDRLLEHAAVEASET